MPKIDNARPVQPVVANMPKDVDAAPIAAPKQEKAATFEAAAKKSSWPLFAAHVGGDSRLVSPAGGGAGLINAQAAIDANSKKAGDFTEARTVDGRTLYFTPEGARAADLWLERANDASDPLRAKSDPGLIEKWLLGDLFDGEELHSGKTE